MDTRPSHAWHWLVLALVVLAGTALRIWLGWWLGHLGDLQTFQVWALDTAEICPGEPGHQVQSNNYPPLYPSVHRLLRWTHRRLHLPGDFTEPVQLTTDVSLVRPIILLLKTPSILADGLCALLIFGIGLRLGRPADGLACATFYAFNPAILYDGAYYGQTDTILFAFSLATVAATIARRPFTLGLVAVASMLFKVQAFVTLIIVIAAVAAQWRAVWRPHRGRLAAGGACALGLVAVLAAITGDLPQFVYGYLGITAAHPRVTNNALNVWWLAYRPWDRTPYLLEFPPDTAQILPGLTARSVGLGLFTLAMACILWRLHRVKYSPYAMMLASASAGWAFFSLLTQMHERYSVPAIGFMCVLCLWERRWYVWAGLASLAVTLNIVMTAYFFFPPAPWLVQAVNWIIWPERQREWTILAVLLTLMLPVCLEALWRLGRPPSELRTGFPVVPADEPVQPVRPPS